MDLECIYKGMFSNSFNQRLKISKILLTPCFIALSTKDT